MFESSVRGWYARWKAAREAAPAPAAEVVTNSAETTEADEAIARWLTS